MASHFTAAGHEKYICSLISAVEGMIVNDKNTIKKRSSSEIMEKAWREITGENMLSNLISLEHRTAGK